MVGGALNWAEEELELQLKIQEKELDWVSWFTANIMYSSGNFKKTIKTLDIKESLYKTEAELEEESPENKKRDAKEQKEKVKQAFNLTDEKENN